MFLKAQAGTSSQSGQFSATEYSSISILDSKMTQLEGGGKEEEATKSKWKRLGKAKNASFKGKA